MFIYLVKSKSISQKKKHFKIGISMSMIVDFQPTVRRDKVPVKSHAGTSQ